MGALIDEYSKMTSSGEKFAIQKGQLNKLRQRPQVLNEHAESSREIQGVVVSGNIVGQIFKASHDNINGINLAMESAAGDLFDDFEEYADTSALQVEWIASNSAKKAELEQTIFHAGSKSMSLPASGNIDDGWKRDFTPAVDFTGFTGQFWMLATHDFDTVKLRVFVEDSSNNTSSTEIVTADIGLWFKYVVDVAALTPDDVTPADITDIIAIGFRVEKKWPASIFYIDDMVSVPKPGSVNIKLFDMGSTMPGSVALDDSSVTQYEKLGDLGISGLQVSEVTVSLLGGFRTYHIDEFIAGVALEIPNNELLIVGNYYAITINYIDTDVSVYGPETSFEIDYYANGYAFTADDESDPITAIGPYSDCMFTIFSTQDVFVVNYGQRADEEPNGGATTNVYLEDCNMTRTALFVSGIQAVQFMDLDLSLRPAFMEKGAKIEQEYNDDFLDSVSTINAGFRYFFVPQVTNG
jgi:hypothetical protein